MTLLPVVESQHKGLKVGLFCCNMKAGLIQMGPLESTCKDHFFNKQENGPEWPGVFLLWAGTSYHHGRTVVEL